MAGYTCEAEYIAASETTNEGVWVKEFMSDLGVIPSASGPVGDITIVYDPPRRGRVIPLVACYDKAHEDGGSRSRPAKGPKPKGDLRPIGVNRHICMTCIVRQV